MHINIGWQRSCDNVAGCAGGGSTVDLVCSGETGFCVGGDWAEVGREPFWWRGLIIFITNLFRLFRSLTSAVSPTLKSF